MLSRVVMRIIVVGSPDDLVTLSLICTPEKCLFFNAFSCLSEPQQILKTFQRFISPNEITAQFKCCSNFTLSWIARLPRFPRAIYPLVMYLFATCVINTVGSIHRRLSACHPMANNKNSLKNIRISHIPSDSHTCSCRNIKQMNSKENCKLLWDAIQCTASNSKQNPATNINKISYYVEVRETVLRKMRNNSKSIIIQMCSCGI